MKQQTLKKEYSFEGKGLHTGCFSHMTLKPAGPDTGILFRRTDMGADSFVDALAENVSDTSRSTTISKGEVCVHTIEHIMSALTGLGVDNCIIELDNIEIPILDGSARLYMEAIAADGLESQNAERKYVTLAEDIIVRDEKSGSFVRITPADDMSIDSEVDFNSRVLGIQKAHWDGTVDYSKEIGICRTFVFFHEIAFLFEKGLVKGGDVDNAIVIVEHSASEDQIDHLCTLFNKEKLAVTDGGYLNNLELHFPDECGRHKLLDLIGDLRLCGGFFKAKVSAFKPGHSINTNAAKQIRIATTR